VICHHHKPASGASPERQIAFDHCFIFAVGQLGFCFDQQSSCFQCTLNADDPEIRAWATLSEIDENLIRRDLTAAQRAKLIEKRKAAYEAVHPETKHGATGRSRGKSGQVGHSNERFTADTAAKTGTPERTIRRNVTRAKALGSDLDRVTGRVFGQRRRA
jgi:hypothetical protein